MKCHFFSGSLQRNSNRQEGGSSQKILGKPWLISCATLGKSHHLSGLCGLHLFWHPWLKNGWRLSQGNRNHARCFKQRGYKTGNWLHRCWKTGRTERGRRINQWLMAAGSSYHCKGKRGQKGPVSIEGGADASGAAPVQKTAPSRHSSTKVGCSHFHNTKEIKKETEGTRAAPFLSSSDLLSVPPIGRIQ